MKRAKNVLLILATLVTVPCVPASATVQITSMTPSPQSPQVIGTSITWTATATDSNSGPLTFQFNVAAPGKSFSMARDFNVGTLNAGAWTSQPFVWAPTAIEGVYKVQVVIKDFVSGESTSTTVNFQVNPLVTGSAPVVAPTANRLVALFSAPSCASGSSMRVVFQNQLKTKPAIMTNWVACHPPATMTFEIAGMYPSTAYTMFSQTKTGSSITPGPTVSFTTGALPTNIPFPTFSVNTPAGSQTDRTDSVILQSPHQFGGGQIYPLVATDLSGKIIWYYYPSPPQSVVLTRPLPGGTILSIQNGPAWNPAAQNQQLLRQTDLAGNVTRETNTGILQQQLLAMGATDGGPCTTIPQPAPVGSACLGGFHHDAIQTLPNGDLAVLVSIEKIFPPGTQGDTSGRPVDIVGDMILVLNSNWQLIWYFDTFQHDSSTQLDINRPAVLGETCISGQTGCPPISLLSSGTAPRAMDWLHPNSLYYWPQNGDLIMSVRHLDWVVKIDYNNGTGTGNVLWRMGPGGDFTFNNLNNDPWPWFSHQHDVSVENGGAGPMTIFDNGNTRVSSPPLGTGGGNSRGMALTVDETAMQVTPVLSVDLGVYSAADGSAQLLRNGDYFFLAGVVLVNLNDVSYAIEIFPTAGTTTGTQVLNIQGPSGYRGFQMPNLYDNPPVS